jgi:hypothetical protein
MFTNAAECNESLTLKTSKANGVNNVSRYSHHLSKLLFLGKGYVQPFHKTPDLT